MNQHAATATPGVVCGYEYTVKRGDSFYLIAHRLGVPLRSLLEANANINPARLMVGDVLCIPTEEDDAVQQPAQEPAPTETPAPCAEPEPAPAETPTQPETPAPATESTDEAEGPVDLLDHPATTEPASAAEPAPEASPQPAPTDCANATCYTVAAGETAADVLLAHDLTLNTLQTANPNTDLTALKGGDTICLPRENLPCTMPTSYLMTTDDTLESVALKLDVSVGALLRANPCVAPSAFKPGAVINLPVV